jgi:hypothetical protein
MSVVEHSSAAFAARRQARRAWAVLVTAVAIFVLLASAAALAGRYYWQHATEREPATLQVISGNGALIRSPGDSDWRIVTETTTIREGDRINTALGTVVWLTMFDGSTVEISEDTIVRIARMRASRFLNSTKHFILEPERGAIYVGMAPHGEYDYVEFTARAGEITLTMADEAGRDEAGAFLFEVAPGGTPGEDTGAPQVRAAVLRGAALLETPRAGQRLEADQQTLVAADGTLGPITHAVRQLIQNGAFAAGLAGWVEFQQQSLETSGVVASGASVELVSDELAGTEVTAVELLRGAAQVDLAQAGIRQRIGKTLRVYSSLRMYLFGILSFMVSVLFGL